MIVKDFNDDGTLSSGIPFPTLRKMFNQEILNIEISITMHIVDERDILEIGISDYPNLSFSLIGEIQYKFIFRGPFSRCGSKRCQHFKSS